MTANHNPKENDPVDGWLDALPKHTASTDFQSRLMSDAGAFISDVLMPDNFAAGSPDTPSSRLPKIGAGMALLASLSVGLWLGFGQNSLNDALDTSLEGLGVRASNSVLSDELNINQYNNLFDEVSS